MRRIITATALALGLTLSAVAVAPAASARPGGDSDERVCPTGTYWKVGHCAPLPVGGPGRRAI